MVDFLQSFHLLLLINYCILYVWIINIKSRGSI
ncbi:hypothetical protein DW082_12120 [Alistipes sp. AF48-12]|nr:hypothetical protein DW082_12120 [Alistipes sp. AF48-12]